MKNSFLFIFISVLLMICVVTSCTKTTGSTSDTETQPIEVGVIIKATASDFWQYVLVGAKNYGVVHPGVNVTTYGPSEESEIAEQVSILEDVISKKPDIIVLASTSSDAANDAIDSARQQGIIVITIDNKVTTDTDAFLATNNTKGGAQAAEFLISNLMKQQNVSSPSNLKGSIIVVTAMAGQLVLEARTGGFVEYVQNNAPKLKFVSTIDVNNDMSTAVSSFESVLDANPDLVGVFANNNITGNAIAQVLESRDRSDIMAVAYDSDEAEILAIRNGWLQGTVVQDPYRMGYEGIELGMQKLAGLDIPSYVDTGAVLVTKKNVNDSAMQGFLDPRKRQLKK